MTRYLMIAALMMVGCGPSEPPPPPTPFTGSYSGIMSGDASCTAGTLTFPARTQEMEILQHLSRLDISFPNPGLPMLCPGLVGDASGNRAEPQTNLCAPEVSGDFSFQFAVVDGSLVLSESKDVLALELGGTIFVRDLAARPVDLCSYTVTSTMIRL